MSEKIKNEQPSDLELFSACCCAMIDIHKENQSELVTTKEVYVLEELEY